MRGVKDRQGLCGSAAVMRTKREGEVTEGLYSSLEGRTVTGLWNGTYVVGLSEEEGEEGAVSRVLWAASARKDEVLCVLL